MEVMAIIRNPRYGAWDCGVGLSFTAMLACGAQSNLFIPHKEAEQVLMGVPDIDDLNGKPCLVSHNSSVQSVQFIRLLDI